MDQQINVAKGEIGPNYRVAEWWVDTTTLRIRNHEMEVKLEPKVMAVLSYLAARPGIVVSRQELEGAVWTNTVVGYDAISNAIIKLRKAFGDEAQNPKILETIRKTGYRLIATVELHASDLGVDEKDGASLQAELGVGCNKEPGLGYEVLAKSTKATYKILIPLLLLIGFTWLWLKPTDQAIEPASIESMAFPLPEKPSIAVLPFANLSDDIQQEYFADGMTEDLITDLSQVVGLFVIARNSVFFYKDKPVKIQQVAEELGVRYVLEGSVRRVNNQVRINAQLIDATTGGHVWAKRYDGSLDDVFLMQDKVANNIVAALSISLIGDERDDPVQVETTIPEAYEAFLRGWDRYRLGTPEDFLKAASSFEKAIELDPGYGQAYSALAAVDWAINFNNWARTIGLTSEKARERSRKSLQEAMELPSALTYQISSERSALVYSKPDRALKEAGQAIALDANDPAGHLAMAAALLKAEKPTEAVKSIRTAMRLDPIYPAYYLNRLAEAQYAMGQFQDAAETLEKSSIRNPDNDWTYVYLTATYGQLGYTEKAQQAVAEANKLRAKAGWGALTIELAADRKRHGSDIRYIFKWFGDLKPLREGLRKAGIPEGNEWRSLVTYEDGLAEVKGAVAIDNNTAKSLHERGVPFVDIHWTWVRKRIPNAHYLDIWSYEFNEVTLAEIVRKDQEIVIYASRGDNTRWLPDAVALAVKWGFENVYHYDGGMHGWESAGYPVDNVQKEFYN